MCKYTPLPSTPVSVRILRRDSNSSMKLGPFRGISSGYALYKPLHRREKPLLSLISRLGVSPNSTMVGNTPKIPPQRPRLQANTCGRIRPQADWRGSISTIRIRDLGRISGPMRTQANLCGRSFLVAEEGQAVSSYITEDKIYFIHTLKKIPPSIPPPGVDIRLSTGH